MNAQYSPDLDIRPGVAAALAAKQPVVALALAPLTHTLNSPANLEALQTAEEAVRKEGGLLAAVAVLKGRLTVGLEGKELERLAASRAVHRVSRRDLASAVTGGWNGGTTVSATMFIAAKAGIQMVATGAIGTARPFMIDEAQVWDISSDLIELSRTPAAVVCSGARSVSHSSYAAEVLDTYRVPVVGYRTDTLPNFYMNIGSSPVSSRVNSAAEAAALLKVHWRLEGAGVVIAQPTPTDAAISPDILLPALRSVEEQADREGVARKDISLFQMEKLNRLTGGKALRAYQAILRENSRLAAQIARDLNASGSKQ